MSGPRARMLPLVATACLLGQGALLWLAGTRAEAPLLPLPWLFLLLTTCLAVVLAFGAVRNDRPVADRLWRLAMVVAAAVLLAAGVGSLRSGAESTGEPERIAEVEERLDEAMAAISDLAPALDLLRAEWSEAPALFSAVGEADTSFGAGGAIFRGLAGWPDRWRDSFAEAEAMPLRLVAWRDSQRVAWTGDAEPLPRPPATGRALVAGRGGWFVQERIAATGGLVIEAQIALENRRLGVRWPGLALGRASRAPGEPDVMRRPVRVPDTTSGSPLEGTLGFADARLRDRAGRARLFVVLLVTWGCLAAATARRYFGVWGALVALWGGRGLLAAVGVHQWVAVGWRVASASAAPRSAASLVDPAYFATPFAGGWFASTADALLTGLVVAITVRLLLQGRARGRLGGEAANGVILSRPLVTGLVFGLVAGGVLLGVRGLAAILAENANARLIGQGVAVEFLSFWVLHGALLLLSLSPVLLVVAYPAPARWPARGELLRWSMGGLLAAAAALGVGMLAGAWWGLSALMAGLATGLWVLAPALEAPPGLRRRLALPMAMLLVATWNYAVLREVYDAGERNWLANKGQMIAAADSDWNRYLLGDVLEGMRDAVVAPDVAVPGSIWDDEAAWRIWRDSALRDLGLPSLVEILDGSGAGVALHATGFLGDFQYELAARGPWLNAAGEAATEEDPTAFQTERRLYTGGMEEVLVGEVERGDGGWIRVEIPVRSWRLPTLLDRLAGVLRASDAGYRPRSEIDRDVLLLRADDTGWLDAGPEGFPGPEADLATSELRGGRGRWADLEVGSRRWRCVWVPLPDAAARTAGEGFVLGLRRSSLGENLLDLSRLMLLDLGLLLLGLGCLQALRGLARRLGDQRSPRPWRPGFQERFLGGYLFIGLVLLLLVGMSIDRVSQERIRGDALARTRSGLEQAVDQLRSLLVEQARSLAGSEYIADLLLGQLTGLRTAGPMHLRQGMVFNSAGELLLDETLSDLTTAEAADLLAAARQAPMVVVRDRGSLHLGTVIPIDLGGALAAATEREGGRVDGAGAESGFFFYRQRLDRDLLSSLAALVRGEVTLRVGGEPVLTSAPGALFAGRTPRLSPADLMASLVDHPGGTSVYTAVDRPLDLTGCQPLPVFGRGGQGLRQGALPAVLTVAFPDRERAYGVQRRDNALFLAGLANILLLAAVVLAVVLSWNIFRPLRVLMDATAGLARGDYDAPLPEAGRDEVGKLADAFARMRNELRTAQEHLAARERFLTGVLDRVTVGVVVFDADADLVALNPAGRQILADFLPDETEEMAAAALLGRFRDLAAGHERFAGQLRSADGRRTVRAALAPLDLADGRTDTMLVYEDVTEFLENQKLAINAELARQVAHEIKNPLTPIQLSAQLLDQAWRDRHPDLDRIVTDTVRRILDQVELLRRIAGEFSLLGRPEKLAAAPLDLAALTAEVTAAYAGRGADTDAPRIDVAPLPSTLVLGDAEATRKILANLMQNSLDAARPGAPAEIAVDWRVGEESVTLVWSDRGTGIPPEVAGRLFDPYFSTKSKGTGLGLAICRSLADRMGGRISLANGDDGCGAVAELELPRAGHPSPESATH